MRTSTINNSPAVGYTLLEILVVLLIVGFTLGTLLSLGLGTGAQNQHQRIDEFGHELRMMTQSSVLDGRSHGLDFYLSDAGTLCWRWLLLEDGDWLALQTPPGKTDSTGAEGFPGSVWELHIEGLPLTPESGPHLLPPVAGDNLQPEVVLYPTRESTAFELVLTDGSGNEDRIYLDLMGRTGSNEAITAPPW